MALQSDAIWEFQPNMEKELEEIKQRQKDIYEELKVLQFYSKINQTQNNGTTSVVDREFSFTKAWKELIGTRRKKCK